MLHRDKRDGMLYDSAIKGFDTNFWKAIVGTPTVTGSANAQVLQFNVQSAASYLLLGFADVEFALTIPTTPTAGHSRQFGLISPAQLNAGAVFPDGGIYFDITGTAFTIKVYDNAGAVHSKTLTWSAGYTNALTLFRFRWEADQIFVYINGVIVASFAHADPNIAGGPVDIPFEELPIYINNGVADNMTLSWIQVKRAASFV